MNKELFDRFEGRWDWCGTCREACIVCLECNNSSCTGGGCAECHEDFEFMSTVPREDLPTAKDFKNTYVINHVVERCWFDFRRWCDVETKTNHQFEFWEDREDIMVCTVCDRLEYTSFIPKLLMLNSFSDWLDHIDKTSKK